MSELIDRQAAIDAIRASTSKYTGFMEMEMYTDDDAVEAIEALPSAQSEHWISCSERLPEKDGRYQVTRYDYVANTEFIDILWYEENLWWNRHSTGDYAVTAWMPLPEPWEGEGNERA